MEERINGLLNQFLDVLPAPVGKHIQELITSGEYGVGLEELCSYLNEYDLPVSEEEYKTIEEAGLTMGIDISYWTILKRG
jgi:hypothetical protein